MKKLVVTILISLSVVLSCFIFKTYAGEKPVSKSRLIDWWIGEKIVFLPEYLPDYYPMCYFRSEEDLGEYCLCFSPVKRESLFCPTKEQLAGKTAEIVRIETSFWRQKLPLRKLLFNIVIRLEESGTLLYTTQICDDSLGTDLTLPEGTTLLSYLEKGKKYIGKTVWSKQDFFASVRKLEKVTVVDVKLSSFSKKLLTFYLKRSDGKIRCWDGNVVKDNTVFRQVFDHVFDEEWYLTDPRKLHPNWIPKVWRAIEKSEIYIGMTKEMVLMSWGSPKDVNRTITRWGVREQWVYDSQYLYFENGKLTTIQD